MTSPEIRPRQLNRHLTRSSTQPILGVPVHPLDETGPQSPLELHDESGFEYQDTNINTNTHQPSLLAAQRQAIQSLQSIPYPVRQPSLFSFRQNSIRGSRMVRISSTQPVPEPNRQGIQNINGAIMIPLESPVQEAPIEADTMNNVETQRESTDQQEDSPQAQDPHTESVRKAASLRLWTQFSFNALVLASYIFGYLFIEGIVPANALFGISLGFLVFAMFGPLSRKGLYADFDKIDVLFSIGHLSCLILFVTAALLKYNGKEVPLTHISLLGLIVLFGSCCKNSVEEPTPFKATLLMTKLYIWMQLILIAIKVDDLPLPWGTIFIPTYFALVVLAFTSILIIIGSLFAFCNVMREEGISAQLIIGSIWYCLNALYTGVWFGVVTGLVSILNDDGMSNLKVALQTGFVHSGVLLLFTVILWKPLYKFQEFEVESEMLIPEDEGTEAVEDEEADHQGTIKFKVSKDNKTYLTMVSSTFYAYMGKHFQTNNTNNASAIKKQIENAKMPKKKHALALNVPHHTDTVPKEHIQAFSPPKKSQNRNLDFSEGDIKIAANPSLMMKQGESMRSNAESCVVCYDHIPNGVFMDCGHGGICYDCALDSWKKSDHCVFCRQRINKVLKIVSCKPLNVTKVVESTTKVVEKA